MQRDRYLGVGADLPWQCAEGMDTRRTYDFMGDTARRFMGLPIANPDPEAVKPPALADA
jgi:hypothetical protein